MLLPATRAAEQTAALIVKYCVTSRMPFYKREATVKLSSKNCILRVSVAVPPDNCQTWAKPIESTARRGETKYEIKRL